MKIGDDVYVTIPGSTDTGRIVAIDHVNNPDSWHYYMPIGVKLDGFFCTYWYSEDELEVVDHE